MKSGKYSRLVYIISEQLVKIGYAHKKKNQAHVMIKFHSESKKNCICMYCIRTYIVVDLAHMYSLFINNKYYN